MKYLYIVGLLVLSSYSWATGGGLGGLPSPTTPFMTVAVCLDINGKPIPKTQHLKQQHQCETTGKTQIDKINLK
ncbi:hypothetical protein L4D09_12660 [Photobacterium makurazakiensis]|uniref:hypothetical protein n=1 Tax=Photobacterium makurazakiensis TaxID=2910234 RepID=UPI003D13A544